MTNTKEYGFLISRETRYGTDYLDARVVVRESGKSHPLNPSTGTESRWDDETPKRHQGRSYNGLGMYGHLYNGRLIGFDPDYRDVFSVDLEIAKAMVKTLTLCHKAIQDDSAFEPGDILSCVAKKLGFAFCVCKAESNVTGEFGYAAHKWHFMTIGQGREYLRKLISEMQQEAAA